MAPAIVAKEDTREGLRSTGFGRGGSAKCTSFGNDLRCDKTRPVTYFETGNIDIQGTLYNTGIIAHAESAAANRTRFTTSGTARKAPQEILLRRCGHSVGVGVVFSDVIDVPGHHGAVRNPHDERKPIAVHDEQQDQQTVEHVVQRDDETQHLRRFKSAQRTPYGMSSLIHAR